MNFVRNLGENWGVGWAFHEIRSHRNTGEARGYTVGVYPDNWRELGAA